ncbi:hypothetical protein TIFTF001_045251 [Ficus carica]|uniref:Uncharacterized protein n=1 Tax=Ficus carica TaxID=3494 RepID=A0AA87Z6I9_FICCA|nr:hypothetical protein TIFTF001_045251 [Ficus carica]
MACRLDGSWLWGGETNLREVWGGVTIRGSRAAWRRFAGFVATQQFVGLGRCLFCCCSSSSTSAAKRELSSASH